MKRFKFEHIRLSSSRLDFFLITASTVICALISFIYSVYVRKYVKPLDYGIFVVCNLLLTYLNYIQLGTLNSYNRDYTQLLGAKQIDQAEKLKSTTFTFLITSYMLTGICIIIVILCIYKGEVYNYYAFGFIASSATAILNVLENFATSTVRMDGKFNYSATIGILKTFVAVIVGLFFVKKFGYYGLYTMPLIASGAAIMLYFNNSIRKTCFSIDKKILRQSIKTGVPLLINNLVWTVMTSVDKFVILYFMTTSDLGNYSVALLGFSTIVLIPQSISQVFYYKMSIVYGESKSIPKLIDMASEYTKVVSLFSSIAAIVGFYMLPIFINIFMPNYNEGTQAAQILIIGVALYSTTMLFSNIFSVLKLNRLLLELTFILCIFNVILSTSFCIIFGKNIENVAIGTSFSYALYSFVLIIIIAKQFSGSIKSMLEYSWLPVICSVVPCVFASLIIKSDYIAFIVTIGLSTLCFIFLYSNELRAKLKI